MEDERCKILIADDNYVNRAILREFLEDDYEILESEDGISAQDILDKENISLVLLDYNLPKKNGVEITEYMKSKDMLKDIPVLVISSIYTADAVDKFFDIGCIDYISKPYNIKVVKHRVYNAIKIYEKQRELSQELERQRKKRKQDSDLLVHMIGHIVEFRNEESGPHVMNVENITRRILFDIYSKTERYELNEEKIEMMSLASALHDIGKIRIPEEILNKPGALTKEEFEIMMTHTSMGANMVSKLPSVFNNSELTDYVKEICLYHHEKYDGNGYPKRLHGDEIPIGAQAVSIADVYDALTSKRVYKDAYSHEKAIDMILAGECGTFNPLIIDCFINDQDAIKEIKKSY